MVLLVGILLIACIGVFGYQNNANNYQVNGSNEIKEDLNKTIDEKSSDVKEQFFESKSIAQKHIEDPNAKAGNPETIKIDGKDVDVVPIISNGHQVGEIEIDPKTGEVIGGAGGAP